MFETCLHCAYLASSEGGPEQSKSFALTEMVTGFVLGEFGAWGPGVVGEYLANRGKFNTG